MAMIEHVHFKNFKSLQDLTVNLSPFTLIVGANGSGKSSVLQGMHDLLQVITARGKGPGGKPAAVFAGAHHPSRLAAPSELGFLELECVTSNEVRYGVRAYTRGAERFVVWREGKGLPYRELRYKQQAVVEGPFYAPLLVEGLGSVAYLRLDAKTAAEPHYSDEEEARVEIDGYGLPSVMQRLQLARDGRFEAIEAAIMRVVPSIRRLRAVPHRVRRLESLRVRVEEAEHWVDQPRERTGARIEAEVVGAGWVPADLLSEGTILTLALLTVLHDRAPRALLLDDLDKALHPSAQGRLMGELRAVLRDHPDVQVVATTHSPFLVDHAAIEEVRVIRLDEKGGSHCQPLSEHPKWAKRSGFMKPGEFWAGVGEDWVGV